MRLATCLWGGAFCPIIPVARDWVTRQSTEINGVPIARPSTQDYLEFFEPDTFMATSKKLYDSCGLEIDNDIFSDSRFQTYPVPTRSRSSQFDVGIGLPVDEFYNHLYETEFQFQKRHKPTIYLFKEGGDQASLFAEAVFGMFPKNKALKHHVDNYKAIFDPVHQQCTFEAWEKIVTGRAGYPLYYTFRGMEVDYSRYGTITFFVFDPTVAQDRIDAWNMRLFKSSFIPVNVNWLDQSLKTIARILKLQPRPQQNQHPSPHNIQISLSLDYEAISRQIVDHLSQETISNWIIGYPSQPLWDPRDPDRFWPTQRATLQVSKREAMIPDPDERSTMVSYPVSKPPFKRNNFIFRPHWVNAIRLRYYSSGRYAEALPSNMLTPGRRYPVRFGERQLVSREGFLGLQRYDTDNGYIILPTHEEAVFTWLEDRGFAASLSDAGRICTEVLNSVGGVRGAALFSEPEIPKLLDRMAKSRRTWSDGSYDEFPDRTVSQRQWKEALATIKNRRFAAGVNTEALVSAGIIRLGLSAKCTHCLKDNWYSLDDIGQLISCERCLKEFSYPQGAQQEANAWRYRVVGPFSTPGFAQGAYSVALTLRFLKSGMVGQHMLTFVPPIVLRKGSMELETDFFAWLSEDRDRLASEPDLVLGECKSFGNDLFKEKDLNRLKNLAEHFESPYLVAACLKSELAKDEKARLAEFARDGWRRFRQGTRPYKLVILTGMELFGSFSYKQRWESAGGIRAQLVKSYSSSGSLHDLAVRTQQAYLDISNEEIWRLQRSAR